MVQKALLGFSVANIQITLLFQHLLEHKGQEIFIVFLISKQSKTFFKTYVIHKKESKVALNFMLSFSTLSISFHLSQAWHKYIRAWRLCDICAIFIIYVYKFCKYSVQIKRSLSIYCFICVIWNGNAHFDHSVVYLCFYIPEYKRP